MRVFACRVWWDSGLASALGQPVPQLPRIVGAVRQQAARGWDAIQQVRHAGQVMRLSRCQTQGDRSADLICQGMNLGRPSAARSPDRVGELPPFVPLAERCALTDVLSALVVLITPEEPDNT